VVENVSRHSHRVALLFSTMKRIRKRRFSLPGCWLQHKYTQPSRLLYPLSLSVPEQCCWRLEGSSLGLGAPVLVKSGPIFPSRSYILFRTFQKFCPIKTAMSYPSPSKMYGHCRTYPCPSNSKAPFCWGLHKCILKIPKQLSQTYFLQTRKCSPLGVR
jgi:hypothetical protein